MADGQGGFGVGFAGTIADRLEQRSKEAREREEKLKDAQAQIYLDAIRSGRYGPEGTQHALEQLQKLWGNSKPMKELLGKFGQALHIGHALGQAREQGAAAQGPTTPPFMPAPPGGGATGAPTASAAPAPAAKAAGPSASSTELPAPPTQPSATPAPSAQPSGLPQPPSGPSASAFPLAEAASAAYPSPEVQAQEKARAEALGLRTSVTERAKMVREGIVPGVKEGTPEAEEWTLTGRLTAAGAMPRAEQRRVLGKDAAAAYPGITTPSGDPLDPDKPYDVFFAHGGVPFASPSGETAGQETAKGAAPKVNMVQGRPSSITYQGKNLTPESPEFKSNPELKRLWDQSMETYRAGLSDKQKAMEERMNAYVTARQKSSLYPMLDLQNDGAPTSVTPYEVLHNPGRYAPASVTQQLKNRAGIFDEISQSEQQFNSALAKLPEEGFSAEQRAQLALALRDPDPVSAMDAFTHSTIAGTLTDDQMDYVAALRSLSESAMALRSIGGLGAGSDMLRRAIIGMVPGPGVPKTLARKQMVLFDNEVKQLRRAIPPNRALGMPQSPTTQTRPSGMPKSPSEQPKTWEQLKQQAAQPQP